MPSAEVHDVIIVGGGPAGSVMAWFLARRGVKVCVLERATFPREKVCGDFVEPAGLRILAAMGCLETFDQASNLPITRNRVYFGPRLVYQGEIPYYGDVDGVPPHGYIVPRHELDTVLAERAQAASARVFQGCEAVGVRRDGALMRVAVEGSTGAFEVAGRLVVGADGAESFVARSAGLRRTDRRHIGLSQRAYLADVAVEGGEATIWFDEDIYPGYGWMFPMSDGRVNVGVGLLSETAHRFGLSVQGAFRAAVQRLPLRHPGAAGARLASRPLGGVVKMYGGVGPNHFDGGLLVGDAGSFVDPMTGEGITQGMESAIIAGWTALDALERGRFDRAFLSRFERDFRAYFDPSMLYLDFCAAVLRNRHFREFWLRATQRGFEKARTDKDFGRVAGAAFGGLNLQPLAIVGQVWASILTHVAEGGVGAIVDLAGGRAPPAGGLVGDLAAWDRGWRASLKDDAAWHVSWLGDLAIKWARLQPTFWRAAAPRVRGPLEPPEPRPSLVRTPS